MSDAEPIQAVDLSHLGGWIDNEERRAIAATLPTISQEHPQLFGAAPEENTFLYKAWKTALGDQPHYPAQQIGDCTSFGTGHALDLLQAVEIVIGNQPLAYLETCTEAVYGMGREIGGMLGGGDGCYGSAVSKAVVEWGAVPRKSVGTYSGQRAKEWGRSGVPQAIKDIAKDFKVGGRSLVSTTDEAKTVLSNGYPYLVCSSQGFTMTRDADGHCRPSGSWSHCMSCGGYRTHNGAIQFLIMQSWGDGSPSGPRTDDQPSFSFWIDENVMASMLSGRDSFALSKFGGFEKRPLPASWTAKDYI